MRACRPIFCLGLLILVLGAVPCTAEMIGQGDYQGYFAKDRWGRKIFYNDHSVLFLSDKVASKLSPYGGKPLQVKVTEMDQPRNPGGAMMMEVVGSVRVLPTPVSLGLEPECARVTQGEGLELHITLRNDQARAVEVRHGTVEVALMTDSPGAKAPREFHDPEDRAFWYYQETYWRLDKTPPISMSNSLSYGFRLIPIEPPVLSKNTRQIPSGTTRTGLEDILTLDPKKGCEGDVVVGKELTPGKYSAYGWFESPSAGFASSRLIDFEVVSK